MGVDNLFKLAARETAALGLAKDADFIGAADALRAGAGMLALYVRPWAGHLSPALQMALVAAVDAEDAAMLSRHAQERHRLLQHGLKDLAVEQERQILALVASVSDEHGRAATWWQRAVQLFDVMPPAGRFIAREAIFSTYVRGLRESFTRRAG